MTRWRRHLNVLTATALLALSTAWAAPEGAKAPPAITNSHASLKAYPSAIISLKDPKTGNLFYAESNGRRLVAFDKIGNILWNVDVFEVLPNSPLGGAPVIRHLKLDQDHLTVTVAKHAYVEVKTDSGKLRYLGAD